MEKYKPTEEAKNRIKIKQAQHDAEKSIKGFCSDPYCIYCKKQINKD